VGFADAVGAGVADGDAVGGAEPDGDGETAPESDGDAEADGDAPSDPDGDGETAPESDGDADGAADDDGDADGDGEGLTAYGAIAKVAVETAAWSQNGASAGQASTLARGATCTAYWLWPLGSSPYGCSFTTTPPGPVAHWFVPKSWSRTLVMEPSSPTSNSRSASRSSESTCVPA
jgi:hypothetical protein